MVDTTSLTPLMRQYFDIKNQFPDALVLFQVGDFYELFFNDAQRASSFLGIVLTQRGAMSGDPIPLCGVPRHAVEHYLVKLVKGGFRVVICDQLEAPQPGKIVERGVTQVYTPGTLIDNKLLESKSAHYLSALVMSDGKIGIAFYEMLAGIVYVTHTEFDEKKLDTELTAFMPQEILVESSASGKQLERFCQQRAFITTPINQTLLHTEYANDHAVWFDSLHRFGGKSEALAPVEIRVLELLGTSLQKNAPHSFAVQKDLIIYQPQDYLQLDAATQKNLELTVNGHDNSVNYTLLQVLDEAITGMGSRLIKKWLVRPLVDRAQIENRLDRVEELVTDSFERNHIRATLKKIGDIERILGRMSLQRATYADYTSLMESLAHVPALQKFISYNECELTSLYTTLTRTLHNDPHVEWKIASGYHAELDRLRALSTQGMQAIFELERKEQQKSGISTLKIRYSQAAGYAIEVPKSQSSSLSVDYLKTQSLTNRDRFTTQELKDLEYDINRAQAGSLELENQLFNTFVQDIQRFLPLLRLLAQDIAKLDLFASFAHVAITQQWVRPEWGEVSGMHIVGGRHPIVEKRMHMISKSFVPNDTQLGDDSRTWIITGPNMGGKSTYLRQVALIAILAQVGSFVPATHAVVPILDRIFTRIGSGDHLADGKSTFLVEMEETAQICAHATDKSLVILDEVGRGTSTYDGLALAQAIVEYLHREVKPLCLFATHYHELTGLAGELPGIACYHAASKNLGESVVLLHKIVPGVAEGSFGIQVAISAQLPASVIGRARVLLAHYSNTTGYQVGSSHTTAVIQQDDNSVKLTNMLDQIELEDISPRQAYDLLCKLKETY